MTYQKTRLCEFPPNHGKIPRCRMLESHSIASRPSNLSRVFFFKTFLFVAVSSTNAFIETWTHLYQCTSRILDPAAFSRIFIAITIREKKIEHPLAIPTSRETNFVVYVLVKNRIMNALKYSGKDVPHFS